MAAVDTANATPLEVAADLDGVTLLLGFLAQTPQFEDRGDALLRLVESVGAARDELQMQHQLDPNAVENLQEKRMTELGLRDSSGHYTVEPSGGDVSFVDEKLQKLAWHLDRNLNWDFRLREWVRDA